MAGSRLRGISKVGLRPLKKNLWVAIAKIGGTVLQAVYEYAQAPQVRGTVFMDSPGREPELLTGMAASGANLIVFTTGRGAPQGFPFVPVVKVTGNELTWNRLQDHMDLSVHRVMDGDESLEQAGSKIFEKLIETASGALTKAEVSGYVQAMDIYVTGPVI